MNYLKKITPEWSLRAGLGVMYIYSGIDIVNHPSAWYWAARPLFRFLPLEMRTQFTSPSFMKSFLVIQGWIEILLALVLLCWFLPKAYAKWVAALTALEMAGILVLIPLDAVTFRDFGLLGGAIALFLLIRNPATSIQAPEKKSILDIKTNNGEPIVETFDQFMGPHT